MKDSWYHDVLSFPADSHRSIHERRFPTAPPLAAVVRAASCMVRATAFAFLLGAGLPFAANAQTPFFGTPAPVPGVIQAESFDRGGEGVAYHDNISGNAGGEYRIFEDGHISDVDIIVSTDSEGGRYVVNNFETGEWLGYTINVQASSNYSIELRVTSEFSNSAFHIEIDGAPVSGSIVVPNTGAWNIFRWVSAGNVFLAAGTHFLKIVSDQQYFDFNAIRVTTSAVKFSATFGTSPFRTETSPSEGWSDDGVWWVIEQPDQLGVCATIVQSGRLGGTDNTALRLHTEGSLPSDPPVHCDVALGADDAMATDGFEGHEAWWAGSILFPNDYNVPPDWMAVWNFHNIGGGIANFNLLSHSAVDPQLQGKPGFRVRGGSPVQEGWYRIDDFVKLEWYDLVFHVKWSSQPEYLPTGQLNPDTGFFHGWVNGVLKMDYRGPTKYPDENVYLRLENYHPASLQPTSVIHDRVIRGTIADAVSLTPLQGAYEESAAIYTGSWSMYGSQTGTFNGGTIVASNAAGNTAIFTFTGTKVMWMGVKCNVCGIATVSIDGGAPIEVDTAGPGGVGSLTPESVFSASGLAPGVSHTMVITVMGTHSIGSTDNHVAVDGFYVSTL